MIPDSLWEGPGCDGLCLVPDRETCYTSADLRSLGPHFGKSEWVHERIAST